MIKKIALFLPFLVFLLLTTYSVIVYAAADPIAYWKFDDGTGTTPQDSSSNNIDGSFLTPNPSWSTDVPSAITFDDPYSLDFTGSGDGVSISWPSGLNFAANDPRSFSFWYKPTANGESGGTMARIISWSSDQFEISGTDGSSSTHRIAYYDGSWHSTDITLTLGTWYHVTFTYDGTTAKFYIGSELQDEHSLAGRALSGTMMIGNRVQNSNEGINGFIDDVRVYNYALDSTQVSNLSSGSNSPDGDPSPSPSATATATPSPSPSPSFTATSITAAPVNCKNSAPVTAPDLFRIDTAGTYANLYFTTSQGSNGYNISYGLKPEASQYGDLFGYSGNDWTIGRTIGSLSPNTDYYFKVQAVNGCTGGLWSKTVKARTKSATANISQFFANLNPFSSNPVLITATSKPEGQSVAGVSKKSGNCSYLVQPGDSFWKIASQELGGGKMFADLISLNPGIIILRAGQTITLCK